MRSSFPQACGWLSSFLLSVSLRNERYEDNWRYDPRFTGSFDDDSEPQRDPYGDEFERRSVHSEHSGHSLRSSRSVHSHHSSFSSRSQQVSSSCSHSLPLALLAMGEALENKKISQGLARGMCVLKTFISVRLFCNMVLNLMFVRVVRRTLTKISAQLCKLPHTHKWKISSTESICSL